MIRVVVESPYAGDQGDPEVIERNLRYLRACLRDCLLRGESPFASHGLYTQPGVLDDTLPGERALGIAAGFEWRPAAEKTVVYTDLGISSGMLKGKADATRLYQTVEHRELGGEWAAAAVPEINAHGIPEGENDLGWPEGTPEELRRR